jgi:hypothetical protein
MNGIRCANISGRRTVLRAPPQTLATTTKAKWPFCAASSAAAGNRFHACHESWICLPYPIVAAASRNAYYSKRKNETDFIKEYGNKNFASFDAHQ